MQIASGSVTGTGTATSISFNTGFVPDLIVLTSPTVRTSAGQGLNHMTLFNMAGYVNSAGGIQYGASSNDAIAQSVSNDSGISELDIIGAGLTYKVTFGQTITIELKGGSSNASRFNLGLGIYWQAFKWA